MRSACLALLSALVAACGTHRGAPTAADPELLVVVSANIRYGTARDGADSWPARRDALADLLLAQQPTVLGVQEALDFQVAFLEERLPGHQRLGGGRDADRGGEHACLFVDRARLEVLDHGDFWLSTTPGVAGSVGWDAALPRICTWAQLRDRASGRSFWVWNTHFDHRGPEARRQSALLLATRMATTAGPHLVLGDFNAGESSPPLQALRAAGLRDTYRELQPEGPAGTFHAFRGGLGGEKIDAVLACKGFVTVQAGILSDPMETGRYVSDHHPVVAAVRLARDP
ncbi:MAG: hypothetical protein RL148_616 [Planctomycetota bacterium]|jgi:endonuclease/exonuclease/phosphatase family metal-dependent hydrolase